MPPDDQGLDIEDSLDSLLGEEPDDTPKPLHDLAERVRDELAQRWNLYQRSKALAFAKDAIDGKADLAAAYEGVADIDDEEARRLRHRLKSIVEERLYSEKIKLLRQTLKHSQELDSDRLRQSGIARVYDTAIGVLLDLRTEESLPPSFAVEVRSLIEESQRLLEASGRMQQEELSAKQREYQSWALEQIRWFDPANKTGWHYDTALARINEKLTSFKSPQSESEWDVLAEFPNTKNVLTRTLELNPLLFADVKSGASRSRSRRQFTKQRVPHLGGRTTSTRNLRIWLSRRP